MVPGGPAPWMQQGSLPSQVTGQLTYPNQPGFPPQQRPLGQPGGPSGAPPPPSGGPPLQPGGPGGFRPPPGYSGPPLPGGFRPGGVPQPGGGTAHPLLLRNRFFAHIPRTSLVSHEEQEINRLLRYEVGTRCIHVS